MINTFIPKFPMWTNIVAISRNLCWTLSVDHSHASASWTAACLGHTKYTSSHPRKPGHKTQERQCLDHSRHVNGVGVISITCKRKMSLGGDDPWRDRAIPPHPARVSPSTTRVPRLYGCPTLYMALGFGKRNFTRGTAGPKFWPGQPCIELRTFCLT